MPKRSQKDAICTIITKNYLAYAKTLCESYLKHQPSGHVYVLVLDPDSETALPTNQHTTYINFKKLAKTNNELSSLAFRYLPLELSCAMKPFFIEYLLKTFKLPHILYFDSDMQITNSISSLFQWTSKHPVILTPHFLDSSHNLNDGLMPTENLILASGAYNAGFIGVSANDEGYEFLRWWRERVFQECKRDVANGYLHDQKWLDLVPSLFPNAYVLRDPGCNVAYWNLHERKIERIKSEYTSNGKPLLFFHFSGYDIEFPVSISKYQNRHCMEADKNLTQIFQDYRNELIRNGMKKTSKLTYGFEKFDNGVKIPMMARQLYGKVSKAHQDFNNPFQTESENSYFNWLIGNSNNAVPPLILEMRARRIDLINTFPYPGNKDTQIALIQWAANHGWQEYGMDPTWAKLLKLCEISARARDKIENEQIHFPTVAKANQGPCSFGVNLSGFFLSEKGIGTSVRRSSLCLEKASIPYVVNNFTDPASKNINSLKRREFSENNPFNVNLIHINPADLESFVKIKGRQYFQSRYNIAYWVWEFPEFPTKYSKWFNFFDEVWVPSAFVQQAISRISPIPVVRVPHCMEDLVLGPAQNKLAQHGKEFTFLFCFDFNSFLLRKNPEGLIQAFETAFSKRDAAKLIIKTSHGSLFLKEFEKLKSLAKKSNIQIIDDVLPEDMMLNLMKSCDCYVSLHRSEGFGLTMLEAMSLGKPVIATGYSGNLDFMNEQNSFLIPYESSRLKTNFGPYSTGITWAEPDVKKAAYAMRQVFENPEFAKKKGVSAADFVNKEFSAKSVSRLYLDRLTQLSGRPPRLV